MSRDFDPMVGVIAPLDHGSPLDGLIVGYLQVWDAGTYANTVSLGGVQLQDLPVMNPSSLAIGRVLIGRIGRTGGLIILGVVRSLNT